MKKITNYIVGGVSPYLLKPGDILNGFEVFADPISGHWMILVPFVINEMTGVTLNATVRDYWEYPDMFCVISTSESKILQYPNHDTGTITFEFESIVDSHPILANRYSEITDTVDLTKDMEFSYSNFKEFWRRVADKHIFITLDLLNRYQTRVYTTTIELPKTHTFRPWSIITCGNMGFRVKAIAGDMRLLYPDVSSQLTPSYFDGQIIGTSKINEPVIVEATEAGITPFGLVEISIKEPIGLPNIKATDLIQYDKEYKWS